MKRKKKPTKLNLDKMVISNFQSQTIKGGSVLTDRNVCDIPYSGGTCDISECACR